MKLIAATIIACLYIFPSLGQIPQAQKQKLESLIEERARNFSEYTTSIQKRSGIFGNKTKRDLEKSNEVLISIDSKTTSALDFLKLI